MQLNCFMCHNIVKGGLDSLSQHFQTKHGLTIKRGLQKGGFECGQDKCRRRFYNFYSLRKHIRKIHFFQENNDYDFSMRSIDSVSLHDDDMIIDQNDMIIDQSDINNTDKRTEEENEEVLQFSNNFNLRDSIIKMIIRFHSKGTVTGSIISEIFDEYAEITNSLCRVLQSKVRQFMESRQIHDDCDDVRDVLESFKISKSFEGLKTVEQQMEALKCTTEYIQSEEIPLGTRINNIIDRTTGTFVPTKIVESCQYVPIIDSLSMVLRNKEIRDAIEAEKESSYNGILASFIDG